MLEEPESGERGPQHRNKQSLKTGSKLISKQPSLNLQARSMQTYPLSPNPRDIKQSHSSGRRHEDDNRTHNRKSQRKICGTENVNMRTNKQKQSERK